MPKNESMNHSHFLPLVLILFLASLPAYALSDASEPPVSSNEETILFQDIPSVYGASKYEQKVTAAPSSVTIITYDEIKKYGYRNFADILRSVRGSYTTYDRNYHYLGVRGFSRPGDYNTRVLLLLDGHRMNDSVFDSAQIGMDFIVDIDLIERVEIIRGPSSSIYGTSAFFAVINVITRRGRDLKGIEISGEAGSLETYKGRLSYGNRFQNSIEMFMSGTLFDSEGNKKLFFREFDSSETNNGIAEKCDGDHFGSIFVKTSLKDFTLEGAYVKRRKNVPTASWDVVFNDSRTRTFDERMFLDLKYDHKFSDTSDIMARLFYDKYNYDGDYLYNNSLPGDPSDLFINKDYARGEWWGGEAQLTKRLFEKHKLILGAEYRDNFRQDQGNYDVAVYLQDKRNSRNFALYIQDEFQVLKNVTINAGVRYDHYNTFGGTTNPRVALIYNPFNKTTLKFLYGKAFRAPNAYELYYNDLGGPNTMKPNPDLKPETINTYEAILEQYVGRYLRLTATGFTYRAEGLISQQIDPNDGLIVFRGVDEVKSNGIELEIGGKGDNGLEGTVSYSFQETKDQKTGKSLTNSPRHLGKLNIILPLVKEKLFAGFEVQYTSKGKTLEGNYTDAFFVTNLTLFSQNLIKGLEISGSVYNLFDNKYGDPGAAEHLQDTIQQDGRGFRLKLTYFF